MAHGSDPAVTRPAATRGRRGWRRVPGVGARRPGLALVVALALVAAAACSGTSSSDGGSATTSSAPPAPGTTVAPAVPSAGCGTSTAGATSNERRTISVAGTERWYLLTVPAAHDGRRPLALVLDFHGLGEGAEVHTKMSNFGARAQQEGFVVAFPQGTGTPVHWDIGDSPTNPDLAFVDQLVDTLGHDLCLDRSRTYATGLSYGAIMSSFLACHRADTFAAIAPVAGLTLFDGCAPSRPVPVLTVHGTADPILHFNGGVGAIPGITPTTSGPTTTLPPADLNGPGYPATVAAWAKMNGCDPTPTDTAVSDEVVHRVYRCPPDRDVEFYIVKGGGHAWPGSEFSKSIAKVVGPTTFDIDATKLAWDFFTRFRLPAAPTR